MDKTHLVESKLEILLSESFYFGAADNFSYICWMENQALKAVLTRNDLCLLNAGCSSHFNA